jgi:CRP/FNR family transcriptional regulator, cyclic AMP receptor protein
LTKLTKIVAPADLAAAHEKVGALAAVDTWLRDVIAAHHPVLNRTVCPFVGPAIERGTLFYRLISGCRSTADVVAAMEEVVEEFVALAPQTGSDAYLRTLVAIFDDVPPEDAQRVVIAAHSELKSRCTRRGLMVGEFAPGYHLASTRNPMVNVGESPVPVLALRHMLPSDHRFLAGDDRWLSAWAVRFSVDRVPLFRPLSEQDLAEIVRAGHEEHADAGHVLCYQGDVGHDFYFVLDGEALVQRNGARVATLGQGDFFGELALLTRHPRNATVVADTDMSLLVLSRRDFAHLVDSVPSLAHRLLAGLAERVSEADARSAL